MPFPKLNPALVGISPGVLLCLRMGTGTAGARHESEETRSRMEAKTV